MIKETKKRIHELGLNQGKIKYKVCDLEKLTGIFDVVVCFDVFIHYPQPVAEEMSLICSSFIPSLSKGMERLPTPQPASQ